VGNKRLENTSVRFPGKYSSKTIGQEEKKRFSSRARLYNDVAVAWNMRRKKYFTIQTFETI
jgi:hypothetical protein